MTRPMTRPTTRPTTRPGGRIALAALLCLVPALTACGGDGSDTDADTTTLQVLAAASLTDVFAELGAEFEDDHPGAEVEFSFGSSTDLAAQAADGAPGDLLATADTTAMAIAEEAGAVETSIDYVSNQLVIVTPPDDPGGVEELADLPGADWLRCADEVPCGRAALTQLQRAGVDAEPLSLEEDVRAVLDKVIAGEADAGLVYRSDGVAAGDDVRTVDIPGAADGANVYAIGALAQSGDPDLAQEFLDFVLGEDGAAALTAAGFTVLDTGADTGGGGPDS